MENLSVKLLWKNPDQKDIFLADLAAIADNPLAGHLEHLNPASGTRHAKGISYPAGQIPRYCMVELLELQGLEYGPDEVVITSNKKGGKSDD